MILQSYQMHNLSDWVFVHMVSVQTSNPVNYSLLIRISGVWKYLPIYPLFNHKPSRNMIKHPLFILFAYSAILHIVSKQRSKKTCVSSDLS